MTGHQPNTKTINSAIDKAVAYLGDVQREDGGFDSYSSASASDFDKAFTYQTTFVPALILAALSGLPKPIGAGLKQRLAAFITDQAGPKWSFNYWAKASPERHKQPYPDDLDDTCCALIGLMLHDKLLVDGRVLAAFVKLLLATETQVGGPYRTWLVPADSPDVWHDVDLAVNANIAYVLSLISQPLPKLTAYLEQAIAAAQLTSPYYVSSYPLVYYLARAYKGPLVGQLLDQLQQLQTDESRLTPLKSAILLSAGLRLGTTNNQSLAAELLAGQQTDGSWPAEAFCIDPARYDTKYYNGSASLTTALAIEALQLLLDSSPKLAVNAPAISNSRQQTPSPGLMLTSVRRDCRRLEPDLAAGTLDFLTKLARSSIGPEIIGLPQVFNQSLVKPLDKSAKPLLLQLSRANLYGWAAYTILDDFLDDEGQPSRLPVATLALRRSLAGFAEALPEDSDFQDLVRQSFDTIDGANAWELAHCRFQIDEQQIIIGDLPDYENLMKLAERSLGHSLAPLAILRSHSAELDSRLFTGVQQAFKHYLIARQLNDDAHDWKTDLQAGHITYVVACLLADAKIKPGRRSWDELLPIAQKTFWHRTLPNICYAMRRQTDLGRQNLAGLPGLKPANAITGLLDKIDASITDTLATQRQTKSFLTHYQASARAVR